MQAFFFNIFQTNKNMNNTATELPPKYRSLPYPLITILFSPIYPPIYLQKCQ